MVGGLRMIGAIEESLAVDTLRGNKIGGRKILIRGKGSDIDRVRDADVVFPGGLNTPFPGTSMRLGTSINRAKPRNI